VKPWLHAAGGQKQTNITIVVKPWLHVAGGQCGRPLGRATSDGRMGAMQVSKRCLQSWVQRGLNNINNNKNKENNKT